MSEIQKARDVLAKWRRSATKLPWERTYSDEGTVCQELSGYSVGDNVDDDDARLIVGTAGNPEFWDAIDGLLADAERTDQDEPDPGVQMEILAAQHYAEPLAAAIISADVRMSA